MAPALAPGGELTARLCPGHGELLDPRSLTAHAGGGLPESPS
jgi:hypothetical protein